MVNTAITQLLCTASKAHATSEDGEIYERNMKRLDAKWATAPQYLPKPTVPGELGISINQ